MAGTVKSVITTAGLELLTQCEAGNAVLEFTSFVTGDGEYTESEKTTTALAAMTALKTQKQSAAFTSKAVKGTKIKLSVTLNNASVSAGYYIRECGIYAKNKSDSSAAPILYSIAVFSEPDYMPATNPDAPTTIALEYYTVISNDVNVTIVIDSAAGVTAEELENVRADLQGKIDSLSDAIEDITSGDEPVAKAKADADGNEISKTYAKADDVPDVSDEYSATSSDAMSGKAVAKAIEKKAEGLTFTNVSVDTTAWADDTTYEDYPFKADIALTGVTADYYPSVTFSVEDATSGIFAPVAATGDGTISIYASEKPADAVTIVGILCVKGA